VKRILLCLFILLSLAQARASDTLTIRQVFNFNVGDTFDYAITLNVYDSYNPYTYNGINYERYIITAKRTSINNDTVTYTRQQLYPNSNQIDQLIYYNLDSPVWYAVDTPVTAPYFQIDTGSLSDGRITNLLSFNNDSNIYNQCQYGEGLGVYDTIFGSFSYANNSFDPAEYTGGRYDKTLIYFSKGSEQYGTPYYNASGPNLAHFTPIAEECAFWNYYSDYFGGSSQIRTGSKVFLNSHTYIELLYRTYFNNQLSSDTLIGYFRNDTIGRKVYFTTQPGSAESILYDFTLTDSSQIYGSTYYYTISVDTISIGGLSRSKWLEEIVYPGPSADFEYYRYMEGIGAINDLFFDPEGQGGCPSACVISLTSFCVCGQTLYPDTATGQCQLLTGINNIPLSSTIHLYPNPTTDQIHLSISEMTGPNYQLILTGILGQEVYISPVIQSETTFDISSLSQGMYTWRVVGNNGIIKTGKVIK